MSARALFAVGVVAVLCAACGSAQPRAGAGASRDPRLYGTRIPAGAPAEDFALRDQHGRLVRLSAQHGKLVLLTFLYTHCTDVCPLIASMLDAAVRSLGSHASSVRVLAVSVDPAGDTPLFVRWFVQRRRLGPEFHYLVGNRAELAPVWQAYNILVEGRSAGRVVHAAPVFLIDRSGSPRLFYGPPQREAPIEHDLRVLLAS
jgi:protein SCO1/2